MVKTNELAHLPTESGCYLFRDENGEVLYVGKAKNLKKRICNYFQKKELDKENSDSYSINSQNSLMDNSEKQILSNRIIHSKTVLLVTQIKDIDFIVTKNELEALLLENNLIKKHYPKYNIDLKDSRRYAYILIHEGDVQWLEVVRKREVRGEYYGPFVSGQYRKIILEVLERNFRVLTRRPSPRLSKAIEKEGYYERVRQARQILKGNVDELIDELKEKMKESSSKTYYEYALTLKNQIEALESLKEKQVMELTRSVDAHIINYRVMGDEVYLLLFFIRKGVLEEKQAYNFTYYDDFLNDFLIQYYDSAPIPKEIIVPHEVDEALVDYLSTKENRNVSIIVPKQGDKKDLLDLVGHNITQTFLAGSENMTALKEILKMEKLPKVIECFDISHLSGTNTVASMVTFKDGFADKEHYRKFKIRLANENDDYYAIEQVVRRRYSGSLTKTLRSPDLIVIDGGLGQLGVALKVLKELNIKIPIISIAKKFEEIYISGKNQPLRIDKKNKGLQLLQSIRDEAHRFALTYQRLLRTRELR